eukprot:TRINITY_DN10787_c0_g1_i1.p1 TRINITY_DN10787_c0_g1~~TRINITY_DN10787_c0_g1_i1.p1  ORF type:complete len:341 (+),score=46.91 TRINITY_DN10787_c0_g1_i1:41-1024(+)
MAQHADLENDIYSYSFGFQTYACAWSNRVPFRFAVGSFLEQYTNQVRILRADDKTATTGIKIETEFDHPHPATKIMFSMDGSRSTNDKLATSGDCLRLWEVLPSGGVVLAAQLNTSKRTELCAPLTSFDWNSWTPNIIVTSSLDTTCTLWDVQEQKAIAQVIAHDKEVLDCSFGSANEFVSVSTDGSLRIFDMREKERSVIMFETEGLTPILRVAWSHMVDNLIALAEIDKKTAIVLDTRKPQVPFLTLQGHASCVNELVWAPHSSSLITAADDGAAMIWDTVSADSAQIPSLQYNAESAINGVAWSACNPSWVMIAFGKQSQLLRV